MAKRASLVRQVQLKLTEQLRIGQSKHHAKVTENTHSPAGIFSYSTLKTYLKHSCQFAKWVKCEHKVRYIDDARQYVSEYIQLRIDKGLSAWTVKLDINALAKLYECSTTDFDVVTPSRFRADISRSRIDRSHDKHFSVKNNKSVIDFARATGLRRHELCNLTSDDLINDNGSFFVWVECGKGGKKRYVPVRDELKQVVIDRFEQASGSVFAVGEIKNRMDIHGYRREYARALYDVYARDLESLSRKEKYFCRKDRKGVVFDRDAMLKVSNALGHNRIDVIASNYL